MVLEWISDQVTMLAEAFGEQLTLERVEIYARALCDIPREHLQIAFQRALRERTWFPKVAELRELAGTALPEEKKKAEANAAWNQVNEYLRKWGVDLWPIYSGGKVITPPALEPRLEYALRKIGGLWRLNQVTDESYPFVYRDFCEAYNLAPVADLMAPQLSEQFSNQALAGRMQQLSEMKAIGPSKRNHIPASTLSLSSREEHPTKKECTDDVPRG